MLLEMKHICKSFGAVQAVKDVSLSIDHGEVHGLLGENGAGKSTLMNILAGVLPCDQGDIFFDQQQRKDLTPKKTRAMGIRFIHQELNLFNHLTAYQNLFLSEEATMFCGILDRSTMIQKAKSVFEELEVDIDPLGLVEHLEPSKKQLLEIAKAVLYQSKLIIMDEPTASLNNQEIASLFKMIAKLKFNGVSFIYISHKMPELFEICDRYTVLRDGAFIETGYFKDINEMRATELLVGRKILTDRTITELPDTPVIFEGKDLSCDKYFEQFSFQLKQGEVLAITGLQGDGRGELAEALFGIRKLSSGTLLFRNQPIKGKGIRDFIRAGISMVQRNRKERSIIKDLSILDNLSFASFVCKDPSLLKSNGKALSRYQTEKERLNIKADVPTNLITSLSGGNQQKVILGRWLQLDNPVLILDNPTQGIDVGAKFEIYQLIHRLAQEGKSIIVFSSEFPEIHQIAHRCLVMYKGRIQAELPPEKLTEVNVMYYATGGNKPIANLSDSSRVEAPSDEKN